MTDTPEPGKVYALTGGPDDASIANGNSWEESEVMQAPTHRVWSDERGWHDSTELFPPYRTMEDVREANRAIGNHWFDADTLRFFRSRIGETLYGGRYFVSSEKFEGSYSGSADGPRRYTVREALPTGAIETVGEFQAYATRTQAVAAIRRLLSDTP